MYVACFILWHKLEWVWYTWVCVCTCPYHHTVENHNRVTVHLDYALRIVYELVGCRKWLGLLLLSTFSPMERKKQPCMCMHCVHVHWVCKMTSVWCDILLPACNLAWLRECAGSRCGKAASSLVLIHSPFYSWRVMVRVVCIMIQAPPPPPPTHTYYSHHYLSFLLL